MGEKCGAETASDVCSSTRVVAPLITHKVLLKFSPTLEREFNLLDSVNKAGGVGSFAARAPRAGRDAGGDVKAADAGATCGRVIITSPPGTSLLIENDKF